MHNDVYRSSYQVTISRLRGVRDNSSKSITKDALALLGDAAEYCVYCLVAGWTERRILGRERKSH
jgi:hypothetical protein